MYLNVSHRVKNMQHHLSIDQSTGLNLLIDALHKNQLTPSFSDHMAIKIKGLKNVYYFSGSSLIEDYEYFDLSDLKKVVSFLRNHYDVLLLNSNGFIYDAFTCHTLMSSDMNILPVRGQFPKIKSLKKSMDFLCQKQKIEISKNYYILFDYTWKNQISEKVFKYLMGGQTYSAIPFMKSRHYSQEHIYMPTRKFNHKLQKVYQKTLTNIDRGMKKHEFDQKSSH
jgi:MinD-like ATPase involved in chromosome partitioning or flagellar assembly